MVNRIIIAISLLAVVSALIALPEYWHKPPSELTPLQIISLFTMPVNAYYCVTAFFSELQRILK